MTMKHTLKKNIFYTLILTTTLNTSVKAQENDSSASKEFWANEKQNILSPIQTPAVWVLGAGSAISYLVYRDTKNRGEFGYTEDHAEKKDGDWRYWGNILGWAAFQAGYTLTQYPAIKERDSKALKNVEMMWKSTLYTAATTFALKLAVTEQRRNGKHKFESFPSGHASAAFAFATNVALRHEWYWNFVSVPLALWATMARVADDSHYVHDSIFGAALGTSFALGMYYAEDEVQNTALNFIPMEDGGGVEFTYKF